MGHESGISVNDAKGQMASLIALLGTVHEVPVRPDGDDVLAVLVQTVLSQSTTNANSDRAFGELLDRFGGDWGLVALAPVEDVADAIRIGGLARQKAPRIQAILQATWQRYGEYSLEGLRKLDDVEVAEILGDFGGVGPKTVAFVMMWALGRDVFPMDTHVFRILRRVGLLSAQLGDEAAHRAMLALVPAGSRFEAHMVLVEHGRKVCGARSPRCGACVIRHLCDEGRDVDEN